MLGIYTDTIPEALLSQSGVFTNPLDINMDGLTGGSVETLLYVHNSSTAFYYEDIIVTPVDTLGDSVVDGTDGYSWKLSEGNTQPTTTEWDEITPASGINMNDIGSAGSPDTSTYLPFWVRVEVPRNVAVQTLTDVQLQINATQNNV